MAGYVYLMWMLDTDYYKIGVSKSPAKRLGQVQTGNPHKVCIAAQFLSSQPDEDEKRLHTKWSDYSVNGEWFSFPRATLPSVMQDFGVSALLVQHVFSGSKELHTEILRLRNEVSEFDRLCNKLCSRVARHIYRLELFFRATKKLDDDYRSELRKLSAKLLLLAELQIGSESFNGTPLHQSITEFKDVFESKPAAEDEYKSIFSNWGATSQFILQFHPDIDPNLSDDIDPDFFFSELKK